MSCAGLGYELGLRYVTFSLVQVVQLMEIDLLRQQPRWKDGLMAIRQLMANLMQQVSQQQVTHLPPVQDILLPLAIDLSHTRRAPPSNARENEDVWDTSAWQHG